MGTLKKNLFYAFGAQGLQLIQSILWSLLVPKFLGIEEFGYWQLFIFYIQYGGFLSFGLIDGIYLQEGGKEYSQLNFSLLGYQLRLFCLWQLIILIPFAYLCMAESVPARTFTIITSCIFIFLSNIMVFLMYILQATNNIKTVSYGRVLMTICFIISIILLLIYQIKHFEFFVICYILSSLACEVYYIIKTKEIIGSIFAAGSKYYHSQLFKNIKMGAALLLSNICGMLILGYGRFLVDHTWGIKAFAVISFAFIFINFFMTFVMQASLVLFPELKRWEKSKIHSFYMKKRDFMSLFFPMSLLLYMPIFFFVKFWLPQYLESMKYLLFLMPLVIFDTKMNLLCNTLFKVFKQVKKLLLCNLCALICSIIGISISIYYLQSLTAVVVSMLIAIALRSIVAEILLSKIIGTFPNIKSIITEISLVCAFILTNIYLDILTSFFIYFALMAIRFVYTKNRNRTIAYG